MSPLATPLARDECALAEPYRGFFDDAATFPPGLAPLDRAIIDYVERRVNSLNEAVGPAVLKLEDLAKAQQIASGLNLGGRPINVSAVTPAGQLQAALEAAKDIAPQLRMVAIELKTDPSDKNIWAAQIQQAAAVSDIQVYVELTHEQVAASALELLAGTDLRLKYRTGGLEAHLFPTPEQLAAVLTETIAASTPFKLTAGLHEAIRYTNPVTGFTHHGFLNIAMATEAALRGEGVDRVAALLAATESTALTNLARASTGTWREFFISFGTCSVAEPAESLAVLGLFPPGLG
ncbi:hypothetical protein [Arthrobacter sp. StoSoilB22]|uniref:hypothetical protein n=1 Tax=Arthrobacter sp. StoSoilB22 TaxID=2830996 RepID=UPI001CC3F7BA|nr:hypothetical protein [Arthrobacter sp. StoSoilB22]